MGGLAELKRRKQEKERAERGGAGVEVEEEKKKPSDSETAEEQQPGQLKHVSLRPREFYSVVMHIVR